ncbi:UNVERIFIED_CONTAM: hypothetical protein FKN15_053047 [Acipenser sinensis]
MWVKVQDTDNVTLSVKESVKELGRDLLYLPGALSSTPKKRLLETAAANRRRAVKVQGALVRSRAQHLTQIDAPTQRFFEVHRYLPCADSGGVKMNPRCPPKRVPSAARFFTLCRLTVQPPQSYSVGGQRSSGQLTGKPAGARPDHRGRWCAVSRGHPGRPKPSLPQGDARPIVCRPLGAPVHGRQRNSLDSNRRPPDYRGHPALHVERLYWMRNSGSPSIKMYMVENQQDVER